MTRLNFLAHAFGPDRSPMVSRIFLFLAIVFSPIGTANAETRFVSGYCDAIWVYAVIEHNGRQLRTDELGQRLNQQLWANLSTEDKMKLNVISLKTTIAYR